MEEWDQVGRWGQQCPQNPHLPPKEPPLPQAWPPWEKAAKEGQDATTTAHLHVHEELPEISRGQHDGGVELDDIALVQGDVVVGCQTLRRRGPCQSLCMRGWPRWG